MIKILRDFIEKLYMKQPGNLVMYDSMTGVHTRCYYDEVVKEKYKDKEVFVAFIDINNLKTINDEQGHHAGSDAIRDVAKNLSLLNFLEICRIGGDEFIVIADKEFNPSNLNIISNISYGYVIKSKDETVSTAVNKSDTYMYKRKRKIHNKLENEARKESNKNHRKRHYNNKKNEEK